MTLRFEVFAPANAEKQIKMKAYTEAGVGGLGGARGASAILASAGLAPDSCAARAPGFVEVCNVSLKYLLNGAQVRGRHCKGRGGGEEQGQMDCVPNGKRRAND